MKIESTEVTLPMPLLRRVLCFLLVSAAILFCSSPCARALGPKGDAFFGYSRTTSDVFYQNTGALNGWQGALHLHLKPFLGAEADVAHYGLGADSSVPRTTTYLFGPRITFRIPLGIRLYAHGLLGGEHSANNSGISGGAFTYAWGGGADLPVLPFFAWRFAADHIAAPDQSPGYSNHARFSTGLVFRF
jgi:hypothetical protein